MFTNEEKRRIYISHMDEIEKKLVYSDILRGNLIRSKSINYLKTDTFEKNKTHYFNVESESFYDEVYGVVIKTIDGEIDTFSCDCYQFTNNKSCKHIAACIKNYPEVVFEREMDISILSEEILKRYSVSDTPVIKKEVFVELEIDSSYYDSYYGGYYIYLLKVKLGFNKLYNYKTRQKQFISTLNNSQSECVFGKDFTYSPNSCFFSEKNNVLINYINRFFPNLNSNSYISQNDLKNLLDLLFQYNIEFKFDNHVIKSSKKTFPFKTYIKEIDNEKYELSIEMTPYIPIGENLEYFYANGNIYSLDNKTSALILDLIRSELDRLIIDKKDINLFSKGLLPIIKKQLTIEDSLKDKIVIIDKPETELYFDLKKNDVSLNIKFLYNKIIDYFDKTSDVIRDIPYENEVINDIVKYGFNIDKNNIILNDIEKEVYLIENGLNELSNKYKIFTTENFRKVNLKKKTNISSTFSIGKDNILSYDFNMDGISNKDIVNILKSVKEKKKYYRLKDGDILNLEDESLNEFSNLMEDMEFTDEEIINGKGSIEKYRAIYLDSVKDTKYHIVKTDNLFSNFVDNFYKYKDSNISLTKEDENILRDYQVTGVKWLYNLDKTGFGGILADEMGLGKTIQVIYYIKEILKENSDAKFLIVVPTSLVYNWAHEFEIFGSSVKTKLFIGNKNKRKEMQEEVDNTNVFITTYGLVREDEDYYSNNSYHVVILDEAQNIKNAFAGITKSVKSIKSDVKFALTGTPIENSAVELWSIFDFIMPGYLSSYQRFNSKYKISEDTEEARVLIDGLSNQITPFILRRRKIDVIKELPEKNRK